MLLEFTSQFYRNLLPLPLWFRYLSNSHHSGAIFAITITAAYLMIKGGVTFARTRELYRAIIDFIQDPVSLCMYVCVIPSKIFSPLSQFSRLGIQVSCVFCHVLMYTCSTCYIHVYMYIMLYGKHVIIKFCFHVPCQTYGTTPIKEEMTQSSSLCPICQENFEQPVMLKCRVRDTHTRTHTRTYTHTHTHHTHTHTHTHTVSTYITSLLLQSSTALPQHIFCEDCVLQWFDRQSTCPLCRCTIASNPKWRDGSTAAWPNLF